MQLDLPTFVNMQVKELAAGSVKAYWTCQFAGWGVMFGYNLLVVTGSTMERPAAWMWTYYGLLASLGVVLTHASRAWLLVHFRSYSPGRLVGLTLGLGILLGAVWTIAGDLLFQVAGLFPSEMDGELGVGHYLRIAMGGALTMITWFAFYFGARILRAVHAAEMERVRSELALRDLHIRMLQGRLRPHFLFNTLNSIHFMVDPQNDGARTAIAEFADLMRYHLEHRADGETLLTRELDMLDSYIQLQRLRTDASVKVNRSVQGDLVRKTLPAFACFNVVENAFKHLAPDESGHKAISIEIDVAAGQLHLLVGNTCGPRIQPEGDGRHGLEDTRSTLLLLRPHGSALVLRHDELRRWFTAELSIDLLTDELPGR